jgi:hypothetical protein
MLRSSRSKKYTPNATMNSPNGRRRCTCRSHRERRAPKYVPGMTPKLNWKESHPSICPSAACVIVPGRARRATQGREVAAASRTLAPKSRTKAGTRRKPPPLANSPDRKPMGTATASSLALGGSRQRRPPARSGPDALGDAAERIISKPIARMAAPTMTMRPRADTHRVSSAPATIEGTPPAAVQATTRILISFWPW